GAAYAVAALVLPFSPWLLLAAMGLMCLAAFGRAGYGKRTLLFLLCACALGGGALLLGRASGGMGRLARGLLYAELPWGVFFVAAAASWLLLTVVFRGGARYGDRDLVRVRVEYGGKAAEATLLRDTGNALTDPLTGEGVPVIEASALAPLDYGSGEALYIRTAGGGGMLRAFRCDSLRVDGRALGARLVAVSPERFGARFQGLWYDETGEEAERHALETAVG
ncbi:MAG: sigma-E processing peptidase SpoIIGA, partial [Oscillospiraceae bacterium]|nr:sigma-E processing peptidase SpoIIGA [Oscillospiraceae bacterium]